MSAFEKGQDVIFFPALDVSAIVMTRDTMISVPVKKKKKKKMEITTNKTFSCDCKNQV